jgi:hypothetical protein
MGVGVASSVPVQAAARPDALAAAHAALLRDHRLQFVLKDYHPTPTPKWVEWLGKAIIAAFPVLKVVFWFAVGIGVALIAFFIAREVFGIQLPGRRKKTAKPAPAAWTIDEKKARLLLEEADRLAAEGLYAEAAHLLLLKGVEDVQKRRPREVRPALTSREIALLPQLPASARQAFSVIAVVVERSLFGGRDVDEGGWSECRRSYEALVVAETWR